VDEWRQKHSKAEFQKLYGDEFLSGFVTGGYYFGIIQVHSTSEAKQREIATAVAGSGWGVSADASVASRLQSVTETLEKEVIVYRDGGDSNQSLPRTIDEMIGQIINFPGQVRQDAIPFGGIYQKYDESIRFSPCKEETGLDLALRRANLNELAQQFIRLKELRADVIFVSDHYNDYQRGAGVVFSYAGEMFANAPLPQSAAELKEVASDIAQQMQVVVQTADACRQGLAYRMPEPYILPIQLPEIEGQNMELEQLKKALVPTGTIVMWSGDVEGIPEHWALCDGQNGTPDLREKFIVGAGSKYAVHEEGGQEQVMLTVEHMPQHTHPASVSHAGEHRHSFTGSDGGWAYPIARRGDSRDPNKGPINTSEAGGHTHAIDAEAVGGSQPHENRPPFYALCYIIKL
jgi:microcystin-dependent protein